MVHSDQEALQTGRGWSRDQTQSSPGVRSCDQCRWRRRLWLAPAGSWCGPVRGQEGSLPGACDRSRYDMARRHESVRLRPREWAMRPWRLASPLGSRMQRRLDPERAAARRRTLLEV
eukprot:3928126-Pleurochrysis_carterae.AAC.1